MASIFAKAFRRNVLKQLKEDESGQSLLEFTALLPLILLTCGFLVSGGQMLFSIGTAYYADYMAGREAMVPNADLGSSESAGQQILKDAPFAPANNVNLSCTKDDENTVCTTTGIDDLVFPVVGINGSILPTTKFNVHVTLTLPTENPNSD